MRACRAAPAGAGAVPTDVVQALPVGTRLRILPNHACATAAQFPHYDVLGREGGIARWDRFYGW